ncbi:MAG TPA: hypothetical protein VJ997_01715 [Longimicrobiales bacterium]|nr:hypothetical protein [Longimicrobiales bacterium]
MGLDFLVPIFGILIVLVPVTGLTVVLTAKFATKPIVEALSQLRSGQGFGTPGELQLQIQDLAEQVEALTGELRGIKETQAFDRKLLQERAGTPKGG